MRDPLETIASAAEPLPMRREGSRLIVEIDGLNDEIAFRKGGGKGVIRAERRTAGQLTVTMNMQLEGAIHRVRYLAKEWREKHGDS